MADKTETSAPGFIEIALRLHRLGRLEEAEARCRQILQLEPANATALQLLGALRSQQGDRVEAVMLIERAVRIRPNDFGIHNNHGIILASAGRYEAAIASYDRALAVNPDFYQAHYNRGIALASLMRFEEAVASFEAGLKIQPNNIAGLYNKGLSLASLGNFEDAIASFRNALQQNPNLVTAWDNLGNALHGLKRDDEALVCYDNAISIESGWHSTHFNRGIALAALNRHEEAIASYENALTINRNLFEAWVNRGNSLKALNRLSEAISSFNSALSICNNDVKCLHGKADALRLLGEISASISICNEILSENPSSARALMTLAWSNYDAASYAQSLMTFDKLLEIDPEDADAWNGRGAVLHALRREPEALACFDRAIELKPNFPDALNNRALLSWRQKGDYAAALADIEKSIGIQPDQRFILGELMHLKMQVADWSGIQGIEHRIEAGIDLGNAVIRPFVYQSISRSPAALQQCSRLFANAVLPPIPEHTYRKRNHKKIKLGYVSGEFKEQATAHLMARLYELHDRTKFEVLAIDNTGPDKSAMRSRLEAAFDDFIDISNLSDGDASNLIRGEDVDILINLNGYFGFPRMGIFARRSAPIQVNYLGFPGTLGVRFMDYIIADAIVIPAEEKHFYDENVVWLPNCYQANDDKRQIASGAPSRATVGLPERATVFCNFNQGYKLTPDTFAGWMRILLKSPDSVLWLLDSRSPFSENLRRAAREFGVDGDRLVFSTFAPLEHHLARLACADIMLDSLPYNAHTTASDALWAGIPLLTCLGTTFPGRVAASLLRAIGLPELIAYTTEEYEETAIRLANDPKALTQLRSKLQANRLTYPLFNTSLFRTHIEAAYSEMWSRFLTGMPPASFSVPSSTQ